MENKELSPIEAFVNKFLQSFGGTGFRKSNVESEGYWYKSKDGVEGINLGLYFEIIIEEWERTYESTYKKQIEELENDVLKHAQIGFKIQSELNAVNSKHVTEITSRNKRINDLEARLAEKDKEIEGLKNVIESQAMRLKMYLDTDIEQLQSELTELKDKVDKLREKDLDSGTEILNLMTQLTELKEKHKYDENDMLQAAKYGYVFRDTTSFPEHKFEDSCINNTKQWLIYYNETHKTK